MLFCDKEVLDPQFTKGTVIGKGDDIIFYLPNLLLFKDKAGRTMGVEYLNGRLISFSVEEGVVVVEFKSKIETWTRAGRLAVLAENLADDVVFKFLDRSTLTVFTLALGGVLNVRRPGCGAGEVHYIPEFMALAMSDTVCGDPFDDDGNSLGILVKPNGVDTGALFILDMKTFAVRSISRSVVEFCTVDGSTFWVLSHTARDGFALSLRTEGAVLRTYDFQPLSSASLGGFSTLFAVDGVVLMYDGAQMCAVLPGESVIATPFYDISIFGSRRLLTISGDGLVMHKVLWPSRVTALRAMVAAWAARGEEARTAPGNQASLLAGALRLRRLCRTRPVAAGAPGSWEVVEPFAKAVVAFL